MPNPNASQLDPIRKAAILISTLDHRVADELLERMTDEQAALVRGVAMELDEVPEDERRRVLQEFLGSDGADEAVDDDGVELDAELARKLAAGESFVERPHMVSESEEPPFRFLCDAEADAIAKHLAYENPQVIAVVIAHLPPRQAAELLEHFESKLQASVLRRIAELDTADRDVVREVEKHLKMLLHDDLRVAKKRVIGLSTVASILTAAGNARGTLISSLTRHDRQLARQLRKPSGVPASVPSHNPPDVRPTTASQAPDIQKTDPIGVSFEELSKLSDADLAIVFRESDSKLAILALAGATPDFVHRLLRNLPTREAKALRRTMERIGPLRLNDIAEAQSTVAEVADRLIAAGAIDDPQVNQFSGAA